MLVFLAKQNAPREELVDDAAPGPEVRTEGGDLSVQDFRRNVGTRATEGVAAPSLLFLLVGNGHDVVEKQDRSEIGQRNITAPKIGQFHVRRGLSRQIDDVLRLHVAMNGVVLGVDVV